MNRIFQKLKIGILAAISASLVILRGGAKKKINNPRRIIVIQNAKLGDMVCTTPVFRAIKKKYPDSFVAVAGNAVNKEILDDNRDVDEYIVLGNSVIKNANRVGRGNFDFGIILAPDTIGLTLLYIGRVHSVCVPRVENGYCPMETISYRFLRFFSIIMSHHMGSYAPREYLRLLEPVGIFTDNTKKHLVFSGVAAKRAEDILKPLAGKFVIGIALAAGNKIKEWPTERFAEVADYAGEKYGAAIVIIGGKGDLKYAEEIKQSLSKGTQFIDTTGTLSIDELKALISKLNLFISVDTGPIYVAEAFGVPTIDIVGPMDENEQPPKSNINLLVFDKTRGRPAIHILNSRVYDFSEARRQVEIISPEDVFMTIDDMMERIKEKQQ